MISSFNGEYQFLSNFFVEPDGSHVEGEYQRAKCANPEDVLKFAGKTPAQCKTFGKHVQLKGHWDKIKLATMYLLVRDKFTTHPELAKLLLATGDQELIEGNWWGDRYWGKCGGVGENHLGQILMEVREELREPLETKK